MKFFSLNVTYKGFELGYCEFYMPHEGWRCIAYQGTYRKVGESKWEEIYLLYRSPVGIETLCKEVIDYNELVAKWEKKHGRKMEMEDMKEPLRPEMFAED